MGGQERVGRAGVTGMRTPDEAQEHARRAMAYGLERYAQSERARERESAYLDQRLRDEEAQVTTQLDQTAQTAAQVARAVAFLEELAAGQAEQTALLREILQQLPEPPGSRRPARAASSRVEIVMLDDEPLQRGDCVTIVPGALADRVSPALAHMTFTVKDIDRSHDAEGVITVMVQAATGAIPHPFPVDISFLRRIQA
jgi:hypothetical protein